MNDIPKLGEFRYPYPKNPPTYTDETIKGYIIEIEGLDGSGKSSQTKVLVENLIMLILYTRNILRIFC